MPARPITFPDPPVCTRTFFTCHGAVQLAACSSFADVPFHPVRAVKDLKFGDCNGLAGFWGHPGAFANPKITPRVD